MKIAETKIYLKFIAWFLLVAILPLILLFAILFQFDLTKANQLLANAQIDNVLFGIFLTLALTLVLALVAAKLLSQSINQPVHFSVRNLIKVVNSLNKSIQGLGSASQDSKKVAYFLSASTKKQQQGLQLGQKAVNEMVQSLNQIADKVNITAQNTKSIDKLTDESEVKAQAGLSGLVAVRQLSTEHQKLTQALTDYAGQVTIISQRVESMADLAKYLSLNATIEANKATISEEFSSLVNQIRQLNIVSQQAATSITQLTQDMQRQIAQTRKTAIYEIQETDKSIGVIGQTIKFLTNITKKTKQISVNIQLINKESSDTRQASNQVCQVIDNLNKESRGLVKGSKDITEVVNQQLLISKSLSRSFITLQKITDNLNKMVGKIS